MSTPSDPRASAPPAVTSAAELAEKILRLIGTVPGALEESYNTLSRLAVCLELDSNSDLAEIADAVEALRADFADREAALARLSSRAQDLATALSESEALASDREAECARLRAESEIFCDCVRLMGKSGWDAPGWTLHVPKEVATLLFDVAYNYVTEPGPLDSQEARSIRERFNALRAPTPGANNG